MDLQYSKSLSNNNTEYFIVFGNQTPTAILGFLKGTLVGQLKRLTIALTLLRASTYTNIKYY